MPTPSSSTTIKIGGTSTAFVNEPTTRLTANTVYQITDATKRIIDPSVAVLVEVDPDGGGGAPYAAAAAASYVIDYLFGTITFSSDQGASAVVRISGNFIPTLAVIDGADFEVEDMAELIEKTVFGDTYKKRMQGLQSASGSFTVISPLKTDNDPGAGSQILRDIMRAKTPMLLEYRPGGSVDFWRAWVLLSSGQEKEGVDARLEGTVKFETVTRQGTGETEHAIPTWGT